MRMNSKFLQSLFAYKNPKEAQQTRTFAFVQIQIMLNDRNEQNSRTHQVSPDGSSC